MSDPVRALDKHPLIMKRIKFYFISDWGVAVSHNFSDSEAVAFMRRCPEYCQCTREEYQKKQRQKLAD